MVDISAKIVKFFTKLNDYDVITNEKDYILVTTKININEIKGVSENPMNPLELTKRKSFNIIFLVLSVNKAPISKKIFQMGLHVFKPETEDLKSLPDFEWALNNYMKKTFLY